MAEVSFEAEPVTDVGRTGVSASPDCLWIAGAVESSRVDAIDALHPFGSHVHGLGDGREIEENSKTTGLVRTESEQGRNTSGMEHRRSRSVF